MTAPHDVHKSVQDVVLAWANSDDVRAAATALERGRAGLAPALVSQLVSEVAEITAESVVTLLNAEEPASDGPTQRVGDYDLSPEKVEQLQAWVVDLERTAKALNLSIPAWLRAVDAAALRLVSASAHAEGKTDGVETIRPSDYANARIVPPTQNEAAANPGILSQLAARIKKP